MIFLYYVYSHTINISFAGHFTHPGCENGEDVYNFLSLQELILQPFDLLGADVAYCISSFPKTKEEFLARQIFIIIPLNFMIMK